MTPSLACANKCVFCWRHHTNPVGKECVAVPPSLAVGARVCLCVCVCLHASGGLWWRIGRVCVCRWRWLVDEPEFLIEQAVAQHQGMIKQMKGVPGVLPERFAEGFNVKHCALSLVGEPIMVSQPASVCSGASYRWRR